jgi:hypothetical protein
MSGAPAAQVHDLLAGEIRKRIGDLSITMLVDRQGAAGLIMSMQTER